MNQSIVLVVWHVLSKFSFFSIFLNIFFKLFTYKLNWGDYGSRIYMETNPFQGKEKRCFDEGHLTFCRLLKIYDVVIWLWTWWCDNFRGYGMTTAWPVLISGRNSDFYSKHYIQEISLKKKFQNVSFNRGSVLLRETR